jgi:gamma-glutamylcyclotransferase (GGCT)/AIG2-like uncharacterized protein YtfP
VKHFPLFEVRVEVYTFMEKVVNLIDYLEVVEDKIVSAEIELVDFRDKSRKLQDLLGLF